MQRPCLNTDTISWQHKSIYRTVCLPVVNYCGLGGFNCQIFPQGHLAYLQHLPFRAEQPFCVLQLSSITQGHQRRERKGERLHAVWQCYSHITPLPIVHSQTSALAFSLSSCLNFLTPWLSLSFSRSPYPLGFLYTEQLPWVSKAKWLLHWKIDCFTLVEVHKRLNLSG